MKDNFANAKVKMMTMMREKKKKMIMIREQDEEGLEDRWTELKGVVYHAGVSIIFQKIFFINADIEGLSFL